MLNACIIFNAFLLATRLSKCRGTACAARILNRRLPNNNYYYWYVITDLYKLPLLREHCEVMFALLFADELEVNIGKLLQKYSEGQQSSTDKYTSTCFICDHLCKDINQEQCSCSQHTSSSSNTEQLTALSKKPIDVIEARPGPQEQPIFCAS